VKRLFSILILCFTASMTPVLAVSEADLLPVEQAYPLSARANSASEIEISWKIAEGYYLYKHRLSVSAVDPSVTLGDMILPAGRKYRDEFFGDVETYRQQVTATVSVQNPDQLERIALKVKYQGCADIGVCYPPQTKLLEVTMPAAAGVQNLLGGKTGGGILGAGDSALPEQLAFKTEALRDGEFLVVRLTPAPGYYLYRDKITFSTQAAGIRLGKPQFPEAQPHQDESFGDVQVYFEEIEVRVPWTSTVIPPASVPISVHLQGCKIEGICYPPMTHMLQVDFSGAKATDATARATADVAAEAAPVLTWLLALVLALLGGLILNLMPCVLPVLSFKAMALAQAGKAGHARSHAIWYALGVMASFAALGLGVLALRSAGQTLGWGFQLQQPIVVGSLALLMFAIGLMMSGLFNWGSGLAGMGQSLTEKSGPAGDFFTGVLAVVVASPCTAPFMGSALAFAFTAHWALAFSVFLALGLGLALPFLLIGFIPALATRIPKPGAWMDTLKHWLAYPMYLTAVWLAWVFGNQKGVNGLALLLIAATVLAAALWRFEHQKMQPNLKAKMAALLLGLLAAASFAFALQQAQPGAAAIAADKNYEAFSRARLNELRAQGTPVFIDMTADWCITCKVNEKAVLHTEAFTQLLKDTGTVYLVGDWTNQDPEISAYLDEFKTPGVPLYVVYPNGPGEGRKLPQLLTLEMMRAALTE
jgi:thiol:disulfide interchange protein